MSVQSLEKPFVATDEQENLPSSSLSTAEELNKAIASTVHDVNERYVPTSLKDAEEAVSTMIDYAGSVVKILSANDELARNVDANVLDELFDTAGKGIDIWQLSDEDRSGWQGVVNMSTPKGISKKLGPEWGSRMHAQAQEGEKASTQVLFDRLKQEGQARLQLDAAITAKYHVGEVAEVPAVEPPVEAAEPTAKSTRSYRRATRPVTTIEPSTKPSSTSSEKAATKDTTTSVDTAASAPEKPAEAPAPKADATAPTADTAKPKVRSSANNRSATRPAKAPMSRKARLQREISDYLGPWLDENRPPMIAEEAWQKLSFADKNSLVDDYLKSSEEEEYIGRHRASSTPSLQSIAEVKPAALPLEHDIPLTMPAKDPDAEAMAYRKVRAIPEEAWKAAGKDGQNRMFEQLYKEAQREKQLKSLQPSYIADPVWERMPLEMKEEVVDRMLQAAEDQNKAWDKKQLEAILAARPEEVPEEAWLELTAQGRAGVLKQLEQDRPILATRPKEVSEEAWLAMEPAGREQVLETLKREKKQTFWGRAKQLARRMAPLAAEKKDGKRTLEIRRKPIAIAAAAVAAVSLAVVAPGHSDEAPHRDASVSAEAAAQEAANIAGQAAIGLHEAGIDAKEALAKAEKAKLDAAKKAAEQAQAPKAFEVHKGDYAWNVVARAGIPEAEVMQRIDAAAKASGLNYQWHGSEKHRWLEVNGKSDTEFVINALGKYIKR